MTFQLSVHTLQLISPPKNYAHILTYHCSTVCIRTPVYTCMLALTDLGGARDVHPSGPKFFITMQFYGKNWPNNRFLSPLRSWHPLLWEILHQSLVRPGEFKGCICPYIYVYLHVTGVHHVTHTRHMLHRWTVRVNWGKHKHQTTINSSPSRKKV